MVELASENTIQRLGEDLAVFPLRQWGPQQWAALRIIGAMLDSVLKVNTTIIENTRAAIQQHREESQTADIQRDARRSLDHNA